MLVLLDQVIQMFIWYELGTYINEHIIYKAVCAL